MASALVLILSPAMADEKDTGFKRLSHRPVTIEGWEVEVDEALLEGERAEFGKLALRLLGDKLFELTRMLPAKRVADLQTVVIWIDDRHELTSMQYHPGAGWLKDHGYDPAMEKGVHIPRAQRFVDHVSRHDQPFALLHELAHAYHDQFLGWEDASIREAWEAFCESGKYEQVVSISGQQRKHYALTNEKEFFAEMSECFVGTNDFYPFVRGELREAEPEIFALMKAIWSGE
ncbi:MAG: metallopeptidase [Planctomycetaceae bacterium]|nr:metallopeptidase [Planctomycetaceae bacterium]